MDDERPYREWPVGQIAEQAMLHPRDHALLSDLAAEAARRPGLRARLLLRRLARMLDRAPPQEGSSAAELRQILSLAAGEIAALRIRLARAEAALALKAADGPHAQLHLTPDAPAWLVAEIRRAFRRRYHPDRYPPASRRRAEEAFKRAEAAFAQIEAMRSGR